MLREAEQEVVQLLALDLAERCEEVLLESVREGAEAAERPPAVRGHLTMNGKRVSSLVAGSYKFVVADKASIHNFTLEQEAGGKFEKDLTSVPFVGTKTVMVTLKKGKLKFDCRVHEPTMFGFFTVK
jgi:hypothetical protein